MAFSVKQIKAKLQEYGVPSENLDSAAESICAMHKTDLDAIREERDTYKADAETLATVQKELDALKAAGDGGLSDLQARFASLEKEKKNLQKEYDTYKADQTAKETRAAKESAYRAIAKSALDPGKTGKLNESRLNTAVKSAVVNGIVDGIELDENGQAKEADKLRESIAAEWPDYVVYTTTTGADIPHPPTSSTGIVRPTRQEIKDIKDDEERVRTIAQNLDIYGVPRKES